MGEEGVTADEVFSLFDTDGKEVHVHTCPSLHTQVRCEPRIIFGQAIAAKDLGPALRSLGKRLTDDNIAVLTSKAEAAGGTIAKASFQVRSWMG